MTKKILSFLLALTAFGFQAHGLSPQQKTAVENQLIDIITQEILGQKEGAVPALERLAAADPENDAVFYNLAIRHYVSGATGKALACIKKACALDPGNLKYRECLAMMYSAAGEAEKSSDTYIELMNQAPNKYTNAYTLALLADKYLRERRDSLALENYDQALTYDPNYAAALAGRVEVFRMRGNMPAFFAALEQFASCSSVNPYPKCEYVKSILSRADAVTYRKWNRQMDDIVDKCVSVSPRDSSALKLGGWWFYGTGRKEKGKELFERFAETYPKDIEAHYFILQFKAIDNDTPGMVQEAKKILELSKTDKTELVRAYSTLGDCYYQASDRKRAFSCYEKALRIDPEFLLVLNNYAYYLCLEKRNLRKAEKMSRITVEKEPDNPTYLDTYGWILHLMGLDAEAKPFFKKAMSVGGKESAEVLTHYVEVLEALGESDLASFYKGLAEKKK